MLLHSFSISELSRVKALICILPPHPPTLKLRRAPGVNLPNHESRRSPKGEDGPVALKRFKFKDALHGSTGSPQVQAASSFASHLKQLG